MLVDKIECSNTSCEWYSKCNKNCLDTKHTCSIAKGMKDWCGNSNLCYPPKGGVIYAQSIKHNDNGRITIEKMLRYSGVKKNSRMLFYIVNPFSSNPVKHVWLNKKQVLNLVAM